MSRKTSTAVTVYLTATCEYSRRPMRRLDALGVRNHRVDIGRDPAAAALVQRLNDGDRTVPTVVFGDGSALTNPTADEVVGRLAVS